MKEMGLGTGGIGGIPESFILYQAYRGFNLSGVNLAEAGHSTMRVCYKMSLAVAAWKDSVPTDYTRLGLHSFC